MEETIVPAGEFSEEYLKSLMVKEMDEIVKEMEGTPYYEALSKIGSVPMNVVEDEMYKAYYRKIVEMPAREFETKLFVNFIKMEIDIRNIKTILRLKIDGASTEEILERIIPGGYELTEDEARKLAAMSFDEISKSLEGYWFWKEVENVTEELSEIEVNFDKAWISAIARRASNYPLSVLPVLQYMVLKKVEVDNLRILGWGKYYGLPNDEIERQMVIV
jgi:V/A-type H+-transporting ATPase subunit C